MNKLALITVFLAFCFLVACKENNQTKQNQKIRTMIIGGVPVNDHDFLVSENVNLEENEIVVSP